HLGRLVGADEDEADIEEARVVVVDEDLPPIRENAVHHLGGVLAVVLTGNGYPSDGALADPLPFTLGVLHPMLSRAKDLEDSIAWRAMLLRVELGLSVA